MTERHPQSPDEIMADIERTRSEIDATLSALEQRISPREVVNAFGAALVPARDGTTVFAQNLGATVRDNPVPAALVGLGLGWLAVSGSRGGGDGARVAYQGGDTMDHVRSDPSRPHHDDVFVGDAPLHAESPSEARSSMGDKLRDAGERLSERSSAASERVRATAEDVTERARHVSDHVHRRTSDAGGRLSVRAQHAASTGRDFAREHPLGIAVAVAGLGALVAATAIVRSEPRRRYIAEQAGRFRSEISDRGAHVADAARDAADRARDRARDLGDRARGFARDSGDRVRGTARDASDRAKDMGDRARETAESAADKVRAKSEEARGKAEHVAQRARSGDDRAKVIATEGAATAAHTSAAAGGIDPTPGSPAAGASSAVTGATSQSAGGVDPTPSGPGAGTARVSGIDTTPAIGSAPVHRAAVSPEGPLSDGPLNQGARANVKKDAAPTPAFKAD